MGEIFDRQRKQHLCPHCGSPARIRYSQRLSPTYAEGVIECDNVVGCGWRGRYSTELHATLTPSSQPNPSVQLPLSQYALAGRVLRRGHVKTKNPLDPHRDQLPLFSSDKTGASYDHH